MGGGTEIFWDFACCLVNLLELADLVKGLLKFDSGEEIFGSDEDLAGENKLSSEAELFVESGEFMLSSADAKVSSG